MTHFAFLGFGGFADTCKNHILTIRVCFVPSVNGILISHDSFFIPWGCLLRNGIQLVTHFQLILGLEISIKTCNYASVAYQSNLQKFFFKRRIAFLIDYKILVIVWILVSNISNLGIYMPLLGC